MTERLICKTPSPAMAKPSGPAGLGRAERVVSEQLQRINKDWTQLQGGRNRGSSLGNSSDVLKNLKEEIDNVDSSMGFRELERVRLNPYPLTEAYCKNQTSKF